MTPARIACLLSLLLAAGCSTVPMPRMPKMDIWPDGAAPDRLFAMTTAQVTLDTGLGLKHKGSAGIVSTP